MQSVPIYTPNDGNVIWVRLVCPAEQKAWSFGDGGNAALKLAAATSKELTSTQISFDPVFLAYWFTVPTTLPTEKEYDLLAYSDIEQKVLHSAFRYYNDPMKGFINVGKMNRVQ